MCSHHQPLSNSGIFSSPQKKPSAVGSHSPLFCLPACGSHWSTSVSGRASSGHLIQGGFHVLMCLASLTERDCTVHPRGSSCQCSLLFLAGGHCLPGGGLISWRTFRLCLLFGCHGHRAHVCVNTLSFLRCVPGARVAGPARLLEERPGGFPWRLLCSHSQQQVCEGSDFPHPRQHLPLSVVFSAVPVGVRWL